MHPLVADVVGYPLSDQEVRQLGQAPGKERQAMLSGLGLGDFIDLPALDKVNFGASPPRYFGYRELNPSALKFRITSRTGPRW